MIKIFDIERYATKDGPGIRTVLFFKGCNLRCEWCQNPESQSPLTQVMFYQNQCSGCGRCITACPESAIDFIEGFGFITDPVKCSGCGICVDTCFYDARRMVGVDYSLDGIMEKILADKSFYDESGGGVTFSGGEPLLYPEDLKDIAKLCKAENIHTAVETAASVKWKVIESLIDDIDLFFVDLKHIDPEVHKKYTGIDNIRIIENIKKLSRLHPNVVIRIPVVPHVNHSEEIMTRMLTFLAFDTDIKNVELLPFHRLGTGKYNGLGMIYKSSDIENVEIEECRIYEKIGKKLGLLIHTGAV